MIEAEDAVVLLYFPPAFVALICARSEKVLPLILFAFAALLTIVTWAEGDVLFLDEWKKAVVANACRCTQVACVSAHVATRYSLLSRGRRIAATACTALLSGALTYVVKIQAIRHASEDDDESTARAIETMEVETCVTTLVCAGAVFSIRESLRRRDDPSPPVRSIECVLFTILLCAIAPVKSVFQRCEFMNPIQATAFHDGCYCAIASYALFRIRKSVLGRPVVEPTPTP